MTYIQLETAENGADDQYPGDGDGVGGSNRTSTSQKGDPDNDSAIRKTRTQAMAVFCVYKLDLRLSEQFRDTGVCEFTCEPLIVNICVPNLNSEHVMSSCRPFVNSVIVVAMDVAAFLAGSEHAVGLRVGTGVQLVPGNAKNIVYPTRACFFLFLACLRVVGQRATILEESSAFHPIQQPAFDLLRVLKSMNSDSSKNVSRTLARLMGGSEDSRTRKESWKYDVFQHFLYAHFSKRKDPIRAMHCDMVKNVTRQWLRDIRFTALSDNTANNNDSTKRLAAKTGYQISDDGLLFMPNVRMVSIATGSPRMILSMPDLWADETYKALACILIIIPEAMLFPESWRLILERYQCDTRAKKSWSMAFLEWPRVPFHHGGNANGETIAAVLDFGRNIIGPIATTPKDGEDASNDDPTLHAWTLARHAMRESIYKQLDTGVLKHGRHAFEKYTLKEDDGLANCDNNARRFCLMNDALIDKPLSVCEMSILATLNNPWKRRRSLAVEVEFAFAMPLIRLGILTRPLVYDESMEFSRSGPVRYANTTIKVATVVDFESTDQYVISSAGQHQRLQLARYLFLPPCSTSVVNVVHIPSQMSIICRNVMKLIDAGGSCNADDTDAVVLVVCPNYALADYTQTNWELHGISGVMVVCAESLFLYDPGLGGTILGALRY
ncbi:hypothetical protein KDA14_02910, partial [Candidatus Saccharibacteria bacterium]|nr:hypothetical protein [Candidatus Saccharibacteria bacterium]